MKNSSNQLYVANLCCSLPIWKTGNRGVMRYSASYLIKLVGAGVRIEALERLLDLISVPLQKSSEANP